MNYSTTGVRQLRPMSVTELIDATVTLYRENFALLAGVVAVLQLPQIVLSMIYVSLLPPVTLNTASSTAYAVAESYSSASRPGGTGFIGAIFTVFVTGALAHAVAAAYLGKEQTILGAYSEMGWRPFLRLFLLLILIVVVIVAVVLAVAALVVLAVIGGGSGTPFLILAGALIGLAALVAAVYVLPHLYLVPQVIVVEGRGVIASLRRSWFLVRGYYWHVVGLVFLVGLMVGIVSGIIGGVVTFATGGNLLLDTAISGVISIVMQPISLGALTLLYFDQRIRKEGFDLEYAAGQMAHSTP